MVDHLDDILASATQQVNAGALGPDVTATFRGADRAPLFPADERDDENGAGYIPDRTRRKLVTVGDPDAPAPLPQMRAFLAASGEYLDYCKAPDIERIADALIAHCSELAFLQNVIIRYLWKRKKQAKNGKIILGTCAALSGVPQFALGGGEFIVTLNWQNCRDAELKAWQLEALIYRQLCKIAPADDEEPNSRPTITDEDARYFFAELTRYGTWYPELEQARDVFEQMAMQGLS